jgi:iron-only hydrogenase group A
LGEFFGKEPGTIMTKKIVFALKKIGFDYVFDTSFGADVAVMEECFEFEKRLKNNGPFPMINSCCPGTVSFIEHSYPELIPHVATVKSPMEILGSLIKTAFAKEKKIPPEKICSVAIMPCVIKKAEALRPELRMNGKLVIDGVLTTKELGEILKDKHIDLENCKDAEFDSMFGTASGGGIIFGSSGGVCEASLRKYASLHKIPLEKIETTKLRGSEGVREVTFNFNGEKIKIAIINSLRNASPLLNDSKKRAQFHFIEVMACLGGCVGGAGQPVSTIGAIEKRRNGLYQIDSNSKIKISNENPEIIQLYSKYLGRPGSETAIKILHTKFDKICTDCF